MLAAWLASVFVCGCQVQLISDYDPALANGVARLHEAVDRHLTVLSTRKGQAQLRATDAEFYLDAGVAFRSLVIRAQAHPENAQTVKMLQNTQKMLDLFERRHREAAAAEQPEDRVLSATYCLMMRQELGSSFRLVLALELAKNRGDSPEAAQ